MGFIRAALFITSLLVIPAGAFLLVLYIITDIVRHQQETEERGM